MIRSLVNIQLTPDYVAAGVGLVVQADDFTHSELVEFIGDPGYHVPTALTGQWTWNSGYQNYENPADALHEFLMTDFKRLVAPIRELKQKHNAEVELRLVVGAGDFKELGYIPNVDFSASDLLVLSNEDLGISIVMDGQVWKATNANQD